MEATPKIGHNKGIRRASTPCRLPSIRTSLSANLSALTRHLPLVLSMALLFPSLQNLSSVLVQRLWPPHTGAHCSFLSPRAWDVGAFYWRVRGGARRCGRLQVNRPVQDPPAAERQGGAGWHGCGWRHMELHEAGSLNKRKAASWQITVFLFDQRYILTVFKILACSFFILYPHLGNFLLTV